MKWRLAAGWVLAVVLTTALAWQIVAVADERVGERPVAPVLAAPTTTTIELSAITGDTMPPDPTLPPPTDDLTTTTAATSTTEDGSTTSSTATTSPPPTTTSTSSRWATKTISSGGGTVVVSYRPGEVVLETAVPKPGFQTDIEKAGPPQVELEFESSSLRVAIHAEWKDGQLVVDVEEEPHGGD